MKDLRVSATDRVMFGRAMEAAGHGEHERVRVGAVLAKGRALYRIRHNRVASLLWGEVEPYYEGHAERQVIKGQPAFKGTLYVARLQLNGTLAPSWPCEECMTHIKACECVTKIVYYGGENVPGTAGMPLIRKVRL